MSSKVVPMVGVAMANTFCVSGMLISTAKGEAVRAV
jgi:hypothetical protein